MERWIRKIAAGTLMLVMLFAAAPMVVKADHKIPDDKDGKMCSNTDRSYSHTGYQTSISQGSHRQSDGTYCFITTLVYKHNVTCTSCGYVFAAPIYGCTTEHSSAGAEPLTIPVISTVMYRP